jgi:ubiquitin-protein ligase
MFMPLGRQESQMSSPRIRRLESDYKRVKARFDGWHLIHLKATEGSPPEKYCIIYNIRGLYTGPDGKIIERDQHRLVISLGLEYPRRPPQLRLMTPIFHPNFNQTEVCAQDNYASSEGLDDLIIRIGQMIAYQFYNTKSPLNGLAAKWAAENSYKLPVDRREIGPPLHNIELVAQPIPVKVVPVVESKTINVEIEKSKIFFEEEIRSGVDLLKDQLHFLFLPQRKF